MKGAGAARAVEEQGRRHGAARDRRRQGALRPPQPRRRAGVHRRAEQARVRLSDAARRGATASSRRAPSRTTKTRRTTRRRTRAASTTSRSTSALARALGRPGARVRRRQRAHRAAASRGTGIDVVGVDHSAPMLADLRARLAARARRRARAACASCGATCGACACGERFPLVICHVQHGAAPLHARRRRALPRPRARAPGPARPLRASTCRCRSLADLARDPARAYHAPRFRHPTTGVHGEEPRALRLRSRAAGALRVDGVRAGRTTRAARG